MVDDDDCRMGHTRLDVQGLVHLEAWSRRSLSYTHSCRRNPAEAFRGRGARGRRGSSPPGSPSRGNAHRRGKGCCQPESALGCLEPPQRIPQTATAPIRSMRFPYRCDTATGGLLHPTPHIEATDSYVDRENSTRPDGLVTRPCSDLSGGPRDGRRRGPALQASPEAETPTPPPPCKTRVEPACCSRTSPTPHSSGVDASVQCRPVRHFGRVRVVPSIW